MPITNTPYPVLPYSASKAINTTVGSNFYTVPATAGGSAVTGVYVYILGCAGSPGHNPAGGGAFVSGFYSCSPGTNFIYVVGGTSAYNLNVAYGGGAAQGGGFSGVFLSNAGGIVQSNAIAIGGGGGGGGYFGIGNGGGGGYPNGYSGTQGNTYGTIGGGTQTAGGAGGNAGSALLGGAASTGNGAQGGGGGWFGGGSGFKWTPDGTFDDRPAGCGGSSYIGRVNGATAGIGLTSGAYYEQGYTSGVVNTYAGSSSPYYVNATTPFVVFVPATTVTPTGAPVTRVPLSLVPFPTAIPHIYNNSYIYYTVPANATTTSFHMWGAGGPGGSGGQPGGGGAYLTGKLDVIPGETLRLIVGQGGQYGTATQWSTMTDSQGGGGGGGGLAGQGGQGGGRSAIQKFIGGTWTEIVTAGGGGSAGGNAGTYGGNAYYTGTSQSAGSTYGQGRTPTGGSASAGGLNTFVANVGAPWDGTQFTGGFASNAFNVSPITGPCGGGGGGGGYYGGGGGGRSGADTYGGGGGSSYYNATYVTSFSGSNGNSNTAVATNIPGRITGAGMGGAGGSTNSGSNGQVIVTHTYAKTLFTFISNFMSTFYNLSGTYSLVNIANGISANSATPAYVWTVSVPPNAKGKNGILALFFNLYSSAFTVGQTFDYGVYLDGVSQLLSDTGTIRYVQSTASTYAMSSNGISLGTNGLVSLLIPMSFTPSASQIQIGLKNSTAGMTPLNSALPGYTSNIITTSGTINTSGYNPQTLFTTGGSNYYTVPTNTSAGVPTGVYIYLWGSGGQYSHYPGGSGGFVSGYYACAPGTNLLYVVGNVTSTATSNGGGGSAPNQQGGGFSGVFLSNAGGLVQSNAIAIAGGGGAGCLFPSGTVSAGWGGYPNGGALQLNTSGSFSFSSSITGGTQTSGGLGPSALNNGAALMGGPCTDGNGRSGGGGGGWYGGGGNNGGGNGQPGAGGSGYIGNVNGATGGIGLTANAAYENGVNTTIAEFTLYQGNSAIRYPGGTSSPYYPSPFGQGNINNSGTGAVVIIPAIGTSATQIGVKASLFSG